MGVCFSRGYRVVGRVATLDDPNTTFPAKGPIYDRGKTPWYFQASINPETWHIRKMARAISVAWTREQRLIALNLYCKHPFGKLHKGNPIIKEVALKMGRTPSSLALKLCNFASLDPVLHARGIAGMSGAAREDKSIWENLKRTLQFSDRRAKSSFTIF